MTSALPRRNRVTGTPPTGRALRLAFPPDPTAEGALDGGWWPRTGDPAGELTALVAAVAGRIGVVERIVLGVDAWDGRPARIPSGGSRLVRVDWSDAGDEHRIRLVGPGGAHLDLLLIPPDTATVLAAACLAMVARAPAAIPPARLGGPRTARP